MGKPTHVTIASKDGGYNRALTLKEVAEIEKVWKAENDKKAALEEGRVLAVETRSIDEMKAVAKEELSLEKDYSLMEIAEAQLMNDGPLLDKIKARKIQLNSVMTELETALDGTDVDARNIAIAQFKRPVL